MAARPGGRFRRRAGKFYQGLRERLTDALVAHGRACFRLARRGKDGAALRDHLEALARRTGRRSPLLEVPPVPAAVAHVWAWFCDLHVGRPPHRPLAYGDLDAWARLSGEAPAAWEIAALRALDRAWLEEVRDRRS